MTHIVREVDRPGSKLNKKESPGEKEAVGWESLSYGYSHGMVLS